MKILQGLSKEKLQKIVLVAIIGAAFTAGVVIFYVNKQLAAIREAETKSEGLRQQLTESEKQNKTNRQLELQRDNIMTFANLQRATLVTGDLLSWTVRAIGDLAAKHPVRVLGWRPVGKGTNRVNSRYEVFTMHLEVDGNYDELGRFVEAIENKFPAGEIRQVDLVAPNPVEPMRRMNLDISLPILPESQPSKAPARPTMEGMNPL